MKSIPTILAASLMAIALPAFAHPRLPLPRLRQAPPTPRASRSCASAFAPTRRRSSQKNLKLTDAEAKAFWPAYDECHVKLDGAQRRSNRAVIDYVNAGDNLTDANAKKIAKALLDADIDEARALKSCFDRVAKVLPGKKAVRFVQIENKMRALVHFDTAAAIPLVD